MVLLSMNFKDGSFVSTTGMAAVMVSVIITTATAATSFMICHLVRVSSERKALPLEKFNAYDKSI